MKARHGMLGWFGVIGLAMAAGIYMGYAQGPIPPGANLPAGSDNETDLNPDAECCCECLELTADMPDQFCVGCEVDLVICVTTNADYTPDACTNELPGGVVPVTITAAKSVTLSASSVDVPIGGCVTVKVKAVSASVCKDILTVTGCDKTAQLEYQSVKLSGISGEDCVCIGETIILTQEISPCDIPVKWSIVHTNSDNPDVSVEASLTNSCKEKDCCGVTNTNYGIAVVVPKTSGEGSIVVRAEAVALDCMTTNCIWEKCITIECCPCQTAKKVGPSDAPKCGACASCGGGSGCKKVGNSDETLGGGISEAPIIKVKFSLGQTDRGNSAGRILLFADEMSPDLAKPSELDYTVKSCEDVEVLQTTNGVLRQLKAPEALADIVTNSDFKYDIGFYYPDDVGDTNAEGFYQVTGEPFVTWTVENPDASTNVYNRLRISGVSDSETNVTEYVWDEDTEIWSLSKGNGLSTLTKEEEWDAGSTNRVVTWKTMDSSSNVVSKVQRTYHYFSWGEAMVEEKVDPDGAALTRTIQYNDGHSETNKCAVENEKVGAQGQWEQHEHDVNGRKIKRISGWKDVAKGAGAGSARSTEYDYTPVDGSDDGSVKNGGARTVTNKILGVTVGKTYYAHFTDGEGERTKITERAAAADAAYGAAGNLRTTTIYYNASAGAAADEIKSVTHPDGRKDTYTYEYGDYTTNSNPELCAFTTNASGESLRTTIVHGTTNSPNGVAYKTTKEVSVEDKVGNVVLQETYVYTGGTDYDRIDWTVSYYNERGQATQVYRSDGTLTESTWDCCGKESEKDRQGTEYSYSHDALRRVDMRTKHGIAAGEYAAQTNIYTTYVFDAASRRLSETTSGGSLSLVVTNEYDLAGRLTNVVDAAGLITTYDYGGDGRTTTVVRAGVTNVTENYLDGRTKLARLNGVIQSYYDYDVDTNDNLTITTVYTGPDGASSPVYVKTFTDVLGHTVREERPGFGGVTLTNTFVYNSLGQLIRATSLGMADTLFEYDELGNQIRFGLDIDGDQELDLSGPDRVNETETSYETDASTNWWRVTVSKMYAAEGTNTVTTNSIQKTQLTGLSTNLTSKIISIDILGNETVSSSAVDRDGKKVTQTVDHPDSVSNSVSVILNGLLMESETEIGLKLASSYDDLARQIGVTDPRTGTSTTHYNDKGQVDYVENAATNRTWYTYDPDTGRQTAVTNALGKVTRYAHDARGSVVKTWGDVPYPVSHTFDDYGRKTAMSTYRGGSDWSGTTWPTNTGTADTTTWQYHEATGLLTNKLYADTNGTAYSYTSEGKLSMRTWARGVSTTYTYTNTTGEMIEIDYSDSTPDITFTFDRLGRQSTITDAQGTRTFSYSPTTLALTNETIVTATSTNSIARTQDSLGRVASLALNDNYSVDYGYSSLGRFGSVTSIVSGVTNHFAY